jgi:transcriptional regulator with XRE-family HTH domain
LVEGSAGGAHNVHMAGKPHYIREWRLAKGFTLEQLAESIGMTHQNLGKIERHLVPYSEPVLEKLAEALGADKADLISRHPDWEPNDRPPNNVGAWRRFRGLSEVELAQKALLSETDVREVENGKLPLSGRRAAALAAALDTSPGRLREIDPTDIDPDVLDDWNAIPKERRAEARRILQVLRSSNGAG